MAETQMEHSPEGANEAARIAQIAEQNDRFRSTWGADFTIPGQIVMTQGVAALSAEAHIEIMTSVMLFSEFTEDNDPYGYHDFGVFSVNDDGDSVKLYWKIDLFDAAYQFGSDDCADPVKTRRVLTILHPSEY
ncbi:DUF3768 domain-containing protein [Arenibacterium sp. LLYu02]|uniref:DUF3768 domain-containing protein n=1 Tax=Arenibacterium sp. LLYu02 TaxID=3404132 RepID=UPI003B22053A